MKIDKNTNVEQEGTVVALILGRNYKDADITIADHDVYKKVKKAIETYENIMRTVAEATMKEMELDSFETSQYKISKTQRCTKTPTLTLEELYNRGLGVKKEYVIDTKALNDYKKQFGKLPEGWAEVVKDYVTFKIK